MEAGDCAIGFLDDLLPVKLLKTLANPLVLFDSGVWATSPEDGDIESRVSESGLTSISSTPNMDLLARHAFKNRVAMIADEHRKSLSWVWGQGPRKSFD